MCFMMMLKITKKCRATLSLENTVLEKPQVKWGAQIDPPALSGLTKDIFFK